jgi:hypothetical protein
LLGQHCSASIARRDEVRRASEQEESTYQPKHDVYSAAEHGASQ